MGKKNEDTRECEVENEDDSLGKLLYDAASLIAAIGVAPIIMLKELSDDKDDN